MKEVSKHTSKDNKGKEKVLKVLLEFREFAELENITSVAVVGVSADGEVYSTYGSRAVFTLLGAIESLKARIIANIEG